MITGKVIEILDNRSLIINIGTDNGVTNGMIFQILENSGKEVKDPETGEVLGRIKLPKIKVKVVYADKKFSTAETYEFENLNVGGMNTFSNIPNIFSAPKYVKKYKTFEIEEIQKEKISNERSLVKIGDLAEQV